MTISDALDDRQGHPQEIGNFRSKFWLWAVLGFVVLLALQVAKFIIDNSWDPFAELATAKSLADLDWSKWIALANLLATSLIGGAVAGASAYAIKYLSISVNNGIVSNANTNGGDVFGPHNIHQDHTHIHTDVEHLDSVKAEIGRLLAMFKEESAGRRLGRSDFVQLRKLADESMKRRARRMENLCLKLKDQVAVLESELEASRLSFGDLQSRFEDAQGELRGARAMHADMQARLELTKSTLADAEKFFAKIDDFLTGPIALGRAAEALQSELGDRKLSQNTSDTSAQISQLAG